MPQYQISQCRWAIVLLLLLTTGVTSAQEKIPSEYAVYYLKHAKANEVAKSLEMLLIPSSTPLNTPIVAEPRLNALFINAPKETLKQVEQFLKILDQQQENETTLLKVFSLQNISADDAQEAVIRFVGPSVVISADRITNTLIARGQEEELLVLEALLMRLDKMRADEHRVRVTAIDLKHITPQNAVGILEELRTSASIAVDETRDRLLVSGDDAAIGHLKTIIDLVDAPDEKVFGHPMQLRLVWLMEDEEHNAEPEKLDADLEKVARLVEKRLGLSRLKKVTQLLVNVEPDAASDSSEFSVSGETELEVPFDLQFRGRLTGNSQGRPVIDLEIEVVQSAFINNGVKIDKTTAAIATKVTAPVGHSVVLGVTSMSSAASVFVLQVLPADAEAEGPK